MVNKFFKSIFAVATILGSALGFVACEIEGDNVATDPYVEVSESTLNFTNEEDSQIVQLTSNSDWKVEVKDADWVTVTPMTGRGNKSLNITVAANTTGALREATVKVIALHAVYGGWDTKKIKVSQSATEDATVDETLLYGDNFDGEEATKSYGTSNSSWPYLDQFPQFANPEGPASDNVTYTGSGVSIRANSTSNSSYSDYAGSGSNNIFFGSNAYFQVNNISLDTAVKSYKLTFGTEKYLQDSDSTFSTDEFKVFVSKNGTAWSQLQIEFAGTEPGRWNVATANFTLTEVPANLYIKFTASVASAYRLDDVKLFTGNGGQQITLTDEGGNDDGGNVSKPETKVVTVKEFLDAAEDATIYELTGKITRVANTSYGNFDLTDATGTVYVYGLLTPSGEAQKQWAAAGLKEGDTITVYGTRSSYNDTPQMKNATYVSHTPGEGGGNDTPVVTEGAYTSDAAFVCATDDSANAAYSLGATKIGNNDVTGFKLGKGKQSGKFTSTAIGVSGDKYLNFYAVAWKGSSDVSLYFRVNGGATQSQKLVANDGASNVTPYTALTFAATDHYSFKLTGLSATDTIEFSTDPNFELTTYSGTAPDIAPRAIVCGVKLTDAAIEGEDSGSNDDGGSTPTPGEVKKVTVIEFLNAAEDATIYELTGVIQNVANTNYGNFDLKDDTGTVYVYGIQNEAGDYVYTSLGLKEGDTLTIRGVRTSYNDSPQMGSGVYVSHISGDVVEQPDNEVTLSFADKANRTSHSTEQQVWEQNGIKLTNDKGESTSDVGDYFAPARFYKSSNIKVETSKAMTQIKFACNSASYAAALQASITSVDVTVDGSIVTVVLPSAATSFSVNTLSAQVRMNSLTVVLAE